MADIVYLIDTYSLIFQVFHGIPGMTSPTGLPTNALFGISRDLLGLLRDHRPMWMICAWESSDPGIRYEIYPQYKANRSATPEDLVPQIPRIRELIDAFGIPVVDASGWEADDVIATLSKEAAAQGNDVRIITSDKDARQLLGPSVHLYNLRKGTVMGEAELLVEWGIRPDQVVDFQALVGDAVDNVPGIPLVGPKKAAQLLQQYGTLEEILAHADEAPGAKLRENLKQYAETAHLSRQLVRLNTSLDLKFGWEQKRHPQPDVPRLQALFREFGFRRLIDDVRILAPSAPTSVAVAAAPPSKRSPQRSLFEEDVDGVELSAITTVSATAVYNTKPVSEAGTSASSTSTSETSPIPSEQEPQVIGGEVVLQTVVQVERVWKTIDTLAEFDWFVNELKQQPRICLDLETTSVDARRADIVGWAFSWEAGTGYYIPVMGPADSTLLPAKLVEETLRPLLEHPGLEMVNQNIKYDLIVLRRIGITPVKLGVDPMVGDYLLDAGARSHNLEVLIDKYLHRPSISISDLIGTGKKQITMAEVVVKRVAEYATEDADCSLQISNMIAAELRAEGLWDLYWDLERPLIPILARMEYQGIRVDADELRRQSGELTTQLAGLMQEIHGLAGREFNIDSPLQLRTILFEELKLPVRKKTKTGPSTDQDVLEELAALHPLPAKIIEHRQATKLKGTYLDALPNLVNPETGRIHCSFNQVVAATGRLSSSDPNLQNIPIRTMAGRQIRKGFIPGETGWKLVCADYSQIELRMLAHFSQDVVLLDAFARGIDIHTAVAADVYGVSTDQVDADMRRVAKAVNFGVIYGQSAYGLSATLGIPQDEAAHFIEQYFARYSGVTQFLEEALDQCVQTGYARTILGRRRRIEGIRAIRNRNRTMPERTAINSVIQGSAADLIKKAMIAVDRRLTTDSHPARLLLQIHDELVFECPTNEVNSLTALVHEEMESAMKLDVPLAVDVTSGDNWLDQEECAGSSSSGIPGPSPLT